VGVVSRVGSPSPNAVVSSDGGTDPTERVGAPDVPVGSDGSDGSDGLDGGAPDAPGTQPAPGTPGTRPASRSRRGHRRATRGATGAPVKQEGQAGQWEPDRDPGESRRGVSDEPTRDDTDAGWGQRVDDAAHRQWLTAQRPPHWG